MAPPRNTNVERTAANQYNIGGVLKDGPLKTAIDRNFGSVEAFKKAFNTAAAGIQGSGWAWLSLNPNGTLEIETTPNQDPLLSEYSTGALQGTEVLIKWIDSRRPSDWRRRLGARLLPPVQERSSRCKHIQTTCPVHMLTTHVFSISTLSGKSSTSRRPSGASYLRTPASRYP